MRLAFLLDEMIKNILGSIDYKDPGVVRCSLWGAHNSVNVVELVHELMMMEERTRLNLALNYMNISGSIGVHGWYDCIKKRVSNELLFM